MALKLGKNGTKSINAEIERLDSDIQQLNDGLDYERGRIDDLVENGGGGGGLADAPNDGKDYVRRSEAWREFVLPKSDIGKVLDINGCNLLTDHFITDNNNSGWSLSAEGHIVGTGGLGDFSKRIVSKLITNDEDCEVSALAVYTGTRSGTTYGFSIGLENVNSSYPGSWNAHLDAKDTGGGYLTLWYGDGTGPVPNEDYVIKAENQNVVAIPTNTPILLTIGRKGAVVYAKVKIFNTGVEKFVSVTSNLGSVKNHIIPSASRIVLSQIGGDHSIMSLIYTSGLNSNPDILTMGDSKTGGYCALKKEARWSSILERELGVTTSVLAGDGDKSAEILSVTNTFKKLMRPKNVILCLGSNDIRFGVSEATWKSNYAAITTAWESNGANVIHVLPLPEVGLDQSAVRTWLLATYPGKCVDATVGWVNGTHLAADNIHPSPAGHVLIADAIIDANYIV